MDATCQKHAVTVHEAGVSEAMLDANAWNMEEGPVSEATFGAKAFNIEDGGLREAGVDDRRMARIGTQR